MSNALRARKRNGNLGYSKTEMRQVKKLAVQDYLSDKMITSVSKHLSFMSYIILRDKFGFGRKRLIRFWECISAVFDRYVERELTTDNMIIYSKAKGIDIIGFIKTIPMREKFLLSGVRSVKSADKILEAAFVVYMLILTVSLKEEFHFSNPKMFEFYGYIRLYIQLYVRKYVDDGMICEIMKNECGIDLEKGLTDLRKE